MSGVLALPAIASADIEPNNGITEAEGPLSGGVAYAGAIANSTDLDTYYFYVNGQQQIDIKITGTGGNCLEAKFGDSDNKELSYWGDIEEGKSHDFTYSTPPGVNRYYLELYSSCSNETKYSFTVAPTAALVGGASTLVPLPTGEPNESAEQAFGPLLGGVAYAGEIQTENDQDWYKFYTAPGVQQFDIAYTSTSSCTPDVQYVGPGEYNSSTAEMDRDEWRHFTESSPTAGVYYFRVYEGCVGSRYEFFVNPPGALTLTPPPPATPAPAPPRRRPRQSPTAATRSRTRSPRWKRATPCWNSPVPGRVTAPAR